MFQAIEYAHLELCDGCQLSGPHGQILASDGSHSCTVQSKRQAKLSLRFLEDHFRVTEDEYFLVNEQISKSLLPDTATTDLHFLQMLKRLRSVIKTDEELRAAGEVPISLRPWEIGFPDARSRDFLLAPKVIFLGERLHQARDPDLLTIIPSAEILSNEMVTTMGYEDSSIASGMVILTSSARSFMGYEDSSIASGMVILTSSAWFFIESSEVVNSPSPLRAANDFDPEESDE